MKQEREKERCETGRERERDTQGERGVRNESGTEEEVEYTKRRERKGRNSER